jgi:hypothetical protein
MTVKVVFTGEGQIIWDVWLHRKGMKKIKIGEVYLDDEERHWYGTTPKYGEVGHDCIDRFEDAVQDVVDIAAEHAVHD